MQTIIGRMMPLVLMASAVVAAGCSKGAESTAKPGAAGTSTANDGGTTDSSTSHAADEKAIRDLVVQTVEAAGRKDMNTYLRFYAPNAALVLPGLPIQYGVSAPRDNGFPEGYAIKMDTAKVEIARAGDMGYAFGTYEQTAPDPGTKALTDSVGKWMAVFRKQPDGTWGAIADTYNVDPPN